MIMPQSNQRGIETEDRQVTPDGEAQGLNRTSVGLKRITIERGTSEPPRLNRTSVGLKLF